MILLEVFSRFSSLSRSSFRIARSLWSSSQSGLYRAVPYTSLYGEAFNAPFDLDDAE